MKKDELINTIIELYKLWNDDTDNNYAKIDYILHKTCKKLGKLDVLGTDLTIKGE